MESISIIPILGLKTSVPQNSPSLFQQVGETVAATHCVDGLNIDFQRIRNACSKAKGKAVVSNSAIASATGCQGLFMLDDGSNQNYFIFDHGNVYYLDSSLDPVEVTDGAGAPAMSSATSTRISAVRYGNYIVFTDNLGTTTPYRWSHGDGASGAVKLIGAGTEYKFKYLEVYQGRVIGAHETTAGAANENISVRWGDRFDTPDAAYTMPSANQLYKPDDDTITAIKTMGRNACFVYGENSIDRLDYYPNYTAPFGFTNMVADRGCDSHLSIVNVGGRHFLFNRNYGFCEYHGGSTFPANGRPISEPIENLIENINQSAFSMIQGKFIPNLFEIAWVVPLYGATRPTHILFYNVKDGTWRVEDRGMYFIDIWDISNNYTWLDLIDELGGAGATWADIPTGKTWADYSTTKRKVVFAPTDGKAYSRATENDDGGVIDSYRVEPIMDFGSLEDKDLLLELWFDIVFKGNYNITVYHRGGEHVSEIENATWTSLGTVSCNGDAESVIYTEKLHRYHQIKWGNENADERFGVNKIEFKYVRQGRY